MEKRDLIKLFEGKNIRYIWDDEKEDWYFSVLDLISFLTDCSNPEEYIKEMLSCDEGLRWHDIKGWEKVVLWFDGIREPAEGSNYW